MLVKAARPNRPRGHLDPNRSRCRRRHGATYLTVNSHNCLATGPRSGLKGLSMTDTTIVTAPETIPFSELLLLSLEQRFGRLCAAMETTAKAATAGANNIEALTAQVTRLADALDAASNTLGCITESVKGEDGVYRCFVRTQDRCNHAFLLARADDRDTGED